MQAYINNYLNFFSSKLSPTPTVLTIYRGIVMARDDISLQIGSRWATALKKRFPEKNTTKHVARAFDIELRTARSWLEGQAPYCKYLFLAGQKFGMGIIEEILFPDTKMTSIDEMLIGLEKKIYQLFDDIHTIRKRGGHD